MSPIRGGLVMGSSGTADQWAVAGQAMAGQQGGSGIVAPVLHSEILKIAR